MIPMPGDTLDIALSFLSAHPTCYLFPIRRLEKTPPVFKNELDTNNSNDPKQLRKWHTQFPGCNWGIALKKSKLIVVDVDTKLGKSGQESFDVLEFERGELPETLTVRSPSGGFHLYFEEANGVTHEMKLNAFGKDVDSTNYVLVPGCWLSNGKQYVTEKDLPLAPTPEWFAEYLVKTEVATTDQTPEVDMDKPANISWAINYLTKDAPPSIAGSNGENTMLLVYGMLKDNGISLDKAIELVEEYYNIYGKCDPLWELGTGPIADRHDVKGRNAYGYLKGSAPGAATAEASFVDAETPQERAELDAYIKVLGDQYRAEKEVERESKQPVFLNADGEPEDSSTEEAPAKLPGEALRPAKERSPLRPLDTIDENDPINGLGDICSRWIWCTGIERFINRKDPTKQWKQSQFDSEYNRYIDGASVSKGLFKDKRARIQRFHYLAFRPGKDEYTGTEYNGWRPSPCRPKAGDTTLWNEHMNYLFQDEEERDHVLNWMAWIVQNPTYKPNHALLIVGKNTGTGKSFVARVMEQIIGERNTQRPKNSSMGGDFNSWLKDCRLCIIEEVYQVNRRENFNAMRDLITEPYVEVNIKGIPAFKIPNYVCMMGVSNHPEALPLDETDRRWLVIETFAQPRPPEYYDTLFRCLPGEFGEPPLNPDLVPAIYAELLKRDLKGYTGFKRPAMTQAKENMIELSRSDAEQWLVDNAGNYPLNRTIVHVKEIQEAMPQNLQREKRIASFTIPNFLRDKLGGSRTGQKRLTDGNVSRLWVLRNRISMIPDDQIVTRYEKERKAGTKALDTTIEAQEDFSVE